MDGGCEWHPDSTGYVSIHEALANLSAGCNLPSTIMGFASPVSVRDKHGHLLDGDSDVHGRNGCDHRDTPEWKAEHMRKKHHKQHTESPTMNDTPTDAPTPEPEHAPIMLAGSGMPAMPDVAHADAHAPTAEAPAMTASVGVDQAVTQIKHLLPEGADASPGLLIGGAAGLAVVGAAVKFGPGLLKARADRLAQEKEQAHEEKMKQLELEEKKAEQHKQDDEQHGKCSIERAMLEAKVAAQAAHLEAVTKKLEHLAAKADKFAEAAPGSAPTIDLSELEERLAKIEQALKPLKPAKSNKPAHKGKK